MFPLALRIRQRQQRLFNLLAIPGQQRAFLPQRFQHLDELRQRGNIRVNPTKVRKVS